MFDSFGYFTRYMLYLFIYYLFFLRFIYCLRTVCSVMLKVKPISYKECINPNSPVLHITLLILQ